MAKEPFAALLTTIWTGGFVSWGLNFFKGPFAEQISEKYEKRNLLVGGIVQVMVLVLVIYYLKFR